ncbi:MAG: 30S ribosomal protein S18 [Deltaproteobacteria bacterium RIFCSPLOWO2_02_FULL_44_10]|nr:MAG: 30S ribosomal protein S18 [Deltaproteobacteria bacterium RIFCSPHIGHO2_02_FULL_44_16]OGQ47093.1 MAG: 30S ribosomal protein S18 [Deltaproteobacteria bacterium RIFCSPLOWO2_02_FULL_44_10]
MNSFRGKKKKTRLITKKRPCRFCIDRKIPIDYKDAKALSSFMTERGRLIPCRISGNCAKHQREVTFAVKRARILALIPFSATQIETN